MLSVSPASSTLKLGFDSKPDLQSSVFSICNSLNGEAKVNLRGSHMAHKCACKWVRIIFVQCFSCESLSNSSWLLTFIGESLITLRIYHIFNYCYSECFWLVFFFF